jgi:hypothetical protein
VHGRKQKKQLSNKKKGKMHGRKKKEEAQSTLKGKKETDDMFLVFSDSKMKYIVQSKEPYM